MRLTTIVGATVGCLVFGASQLAGAADWKSTSGHECRSESFTDPILYEVSSDSVGIDGYMMCPIVRDLPSGAIAVAVNITASNPSKCRVWVHDQNGSAMASGPWATTPGGQYVDLSLTPPQSISYGAWSVECLMYGVGRIRNVRWSES